MENTALLHNMIRAYDSKAFTHEYLFGFADRGNIYIAHTDSKILPYVCKVDSASRGYGRSLRFRPTKAQKELLKTCRCSILCSAEYFNAECKASQYNRGEIFEKIVTERCGQVWVKDSVPFTESGDLIVNGIHYQIKFEQATFCNEHSLKSL